MFCFLSTRNVRFGGKDDNLLTQHVVYVARCQVGNHHLGNLTYIKGLMMGITKYLPVKGWWGYSSQVGAVRNTCPWGVSNQGQWRGMERKRVGGEGWRESVTNYSKIFRVAKFVLLVTNLNTSPLVILKGLISTECKEIYTWCNCAKDTIYLPLLSAVWYDALLLISITYISEINSVLLHQLIVDMNTTLIWHFSVTGTGTKQFCFQNIKMSNCTLNICNSAALSN